MHDVVICGAGPVGLFLANLLGHCGLEVLVVEKRKERPSLSRAIGIMPPSLKLLEFIGLDRPFLQRGLKIRYCTVWGSRQKLGVVRFDNLPCPHPFILSLPQVENETILKENLGRYPSVTLMEGVALDSFAECSGGIAIKGAEGKYPFAARARYLIGCDGEKSKIRQQAAIPFSTTTYKPTFLMADTRDSLDLGDMAHIFFTARGAVESFPLPQGRRRWIVQTEELARGNLTEMLSRRIEERTGYTIAPCDFDGISPFSIKKAEADRYYCGNVILCGDACHIMSPIGGQGMNIGFGDAFGLAGIVGQSATSPTRELAQWERQRKAAVAKATLRAAISTWIGTRQGSWLSALRNGLIGLYLNSFLSRNADQDFSMLNIPNGQTCLLSD